MSFVLRMTAAALLAAGGAALTASPALGSVPAVPITPSGTPLATELNIRVRIALDASQISLRGYDLKVTEVVHGVDGVHRKIARVDRVSEWNIRCDYGRIFLSTRSKSVQLREPVEFESPSGFLRVQGKPYRAKIRIFSVGGQCEVINELPIEKYLDGLVNSEFSAKWNDQSIAAQVVAARTYAVFQAKIAAKNPARRFDLDSTTKDQVYDGSFKEDYRSSRAVESTRGQVLVARGAQASARGRDDNKEWIKAFYHSTCGGQTELPERVWGKRYTGYKRRVGCAFCKVSPAMKWQLKVMNDEMVQILRQKLRGQELKGNLQAIRVVSNGTLRPKEVEFVFNNKGATDTVRVSTVSLRSWLGVARFRSTAFDVHAGAGGFVFDGRGNGHGVGMCQWGAKVMGEKGYAVTEILAHYYPDAKLKRLW